MGEYDQLMAYGAKPAPKAPEADPYADLMAYGTPDRVSSVGLAGLVRGEKTSKGEAAAQGFVQGGSLGFVDEAQAGLDTVVSKVPGLRSAVEASRSFFARHLPASEHLPVDDPTLTYQERRDYLRRKAHEAQQEHPVAYVGGALGSAALPLGAAAKGKTLVQLMTSGAKAGAALGAASGLGGSEANLAGGDVGGALMDTGKGALVGGAAGAASGALTAGVRALIGRAPSRVLARTEQDIKRGETVAKARTVNKVTERAGEEGEALGDLMAREPRLGKVLAIKAESSPGKVAKAVEAKSAEFSDELDKMYGAMGKADRLVKPQEILDSFDKMLGEKLAAGDMDAVRALRKTRDEFASEYGKFGKLSADTMRGLKKTAGRAGFAGDPAAPAAVKAQVQRDVWRVFSDAIEKQAEGSGVDVEKLRRLNRDVSLLIPIEQALTERAFKQSSNTLSMQELLKRYGAGAGTAALGGAIGYELDGPEGALIGASLAGSRRLGKSILRRADYGLARMAQRGASPEISVPYAVRVSEAMRQGMTLKQAVEAADQ